MKNNHYTNLNSGKKTIGFYIKSLGLISMLMLLSYSIFGQGANCGASTTIALNTLTATFTVSGTGDANSPALSGCTSSSINESWYQFNPSTGYTYVTFQNSGSVTGYVYIYSGNCGALSYISCNQALSKNVCLINIPTVSGTVYYIRVVKTDAGTVSGKLGVYTNAGTGAVLLMPDKTTYWTGSADNSGGKYDNQMVVDCTDFFGGREMGWTKINTTAMPATGSFTPGSIAVRYFITCVSNSGAGKSRIVKSSGDPISNPYATSSNTNFFATTINGWAGGTAYSYALNATANTDFENNFSQSWWGLCVVVNEASLWNVSVPARFYGYNDIFPPFIVVTYSTSNCTAPTITTQPTASTSKCEGSNVSLNVAADGTAPLSYQWKKGGNSILNATNATYSLSSITSSDAGSYTCAVTNSCGSIVSAAAILTVNTAPKITSQTPDRVKCTRDSVLFKLYINASPAPTFQWAKNGVEISNGTNSSYYIGQILPANAGTYTCTITNTCGNTSASVTLSVDNSPFIQDTIPNQTLCEGADVTFLFHATGTNLKYQWSKIGGIIAGATNSTYTLTNLKVSDGNVYTCSVSNSCDTKTLNPFILSINNKPAISLTPLNQTKSPGDSLTYTLLPTGLDLTFQWIKNGTLLTGKTSNPYKIKPVLCSDAGLYSVIISNTCGSISSTVGTLTVSGCTGGNILNGYVKYDNAAGKPMTNTTVYLENSNSERIASTQTDANGFYQFSNLLPDTYKLDCETTLPWGGATSADGLLIIKYFVGLATFSDDLKKEAADVNLDKKINSTDALIINKRYVSMISKFTAPDWLFEAPPVVLDGLDIQQDIKAICSGDCNGSYTW